MAKKQLAKKVTTKSKVNTKNVQSFSSWQLGLLSTVSFIASYIFASLAIDSGSLLHYFLCFATVYLAIKFTTQTFKSLTKETK